MISAPSSAAGCIALRWAIRSGVSRHISTTLRRSLSATSTALVSRLVVLPYAISDSERIEHGATTMPIVRNEPEEMAAPMSSLG